jgi:thymidylate kinase
VNAEQLAGFRVVALDGCDGTGKTSLANMLATDHGFTIVHSPPTPDQVDLASRYRDLISGDGPLVMDRCFISELVYGPIHRGRSRLSLEDAFDLAEAVTAHHGIMVHMTAPAQVIQRRLTERDGPPTTPIEEITELIGAYRRVFDAVAEHARVVGIDTAEIAEPFR